MSDNTFTIFTDGGSRGNPGPAAYAFVIEANGATLCEEKVYLGHTTNNIAEYTGLVKALERARELGGRRLEVFSDSELMVRQMSGDYRVKNAGLLPLYNEATRLARGFESVSLRHVRRHLNTYADRLCNEALDSPEEHRPLPTFARPAQPAPAPAAVPAPEPPTADVPSRIVQRLTEAARLWARGDATDPDPANVWAEIWQTVVDAKLAKKPTKPRKPRAKEAPPQETEGGTP